ncbi:AMP-binding protein [Pseudooceanicola nanhaiensis]|uniref:AMP-binding protein n=1 Tax=Pseudooceanicola nanhaiensis TaxID=375761 RepID=UPI001CD1F130|nr:AMP-binding protein [Pseudooceanicola nanhaiensis]MCA0921305.1 AMP-binding protein [Pseudooceanicola nanhaiensis]
MPDLFRWSPETALCLGAQPVSDADPAPLARALCALRDAIRAEGEILCGPEGISLLPQGTPGFLRLRSAGTTGQPKTIRRSHGSWIASFEVNRRTLSLTTADRTAIMGDLAHSLALYGAVEAAHIGADLYQLAGLRPRSQAQVLSDCAITVLYATPTHLLHLASTGAALPALRHILCGGGRMPAGLRAAVAQMAPNAVLREFYGAAETSFIAWGDGAGPEGTVGRAYPGVEIEIRGEGEIWVRSPYIAEGYVEGDSAETRREGGFVTVGEMGQMDAEGFLTVAGRRNRMVTIAGQNVFPEDIEALLLGEPDVTACAVVPRPDALRGATLVAVVDGTPDPLREARLLALCRTSVGPLAAPRRIVALADFPQTVSGKPDLRAIAALLEAP